MLEERDYQAVPIHSLSELNRRLKKLNCQVIIIDLDTVVVDNRIIRELTKIIPSAYFFCLSERRFHPELKEAMHNHFFACLCKPIDPDELFFFLRAIYENDEDPKNHSQT